MSIDFRNVFKAIYKWQCKLYHTRTGLKDVMEIPIIVPALISKTADKSKSYVRYKVLQWDFDIPSNLWIISSQPGQSLIPCTDEHIERLLVVIDDAGECGCSLNDIAFYFSDLYDSEEINQEIMINANSMIQFLLKLEILGKVTKKRGISYL